MLTGDMYVTRAPTIGDNADGSCCDSVYAEDTGRAENVILLIVLPW